MMAPLMYVKNLFNIRLGCQQAGINIGLLPIPPDQVAECIYHGKKGSVDFIADHFQNEHFGRVLKKPFFHGNCHACMTKFRNPAELLLHLKNPLRCPYKFCCKVSDSLDAYVGHLIICQGLRPYLCETCGAGFQTTIDLDNHKEETYGEAKDEVDAALLPIEGPYISLEDLINTLENN